jgi:hypothetical protein
MSTVRLPRADGTWLEHTLGTPPAWQRPQEGIGSRIAFAAAHVVADRFSETVPGAPAVVDWEATLAFRRHLSSWGLVVAEAMDTAQRGMGLDWAATQELIRRSAAEAKHAGARIAAGAGTDHLSVTAPSIQDVLHGYEEQLAVVEDAGAQPILMASRQLAAVAKSPDDYLAVYSALLAQTTRPVILHWLGAAFDPALEGYWGSSDIPSATATVLELIKQHSDKIDGIKLSLLDAKHEKLLRAQLPDGVRLYTGDDFNYPELIRGDGRHHSDALLGVFAAIPQAAATALQALDRGDDAAYDAAFEPTVALARHLFTAPTYYYKTGIAFLAYLNGLQPAFTMIGGLHAARSAVHLAEVFRLADRAGVVIDPEHAAARLRAFLATSTGANA